MLTSHITAYTFLVSLLPFRDIVPYGRNVVYAGNVNRNSS